MLFKKSMLFCTIGLKYIFEFIAGAMNFFASVAIIVVVSISSAIPPAIFPIILAVAGAIKKTSAVFARDMWSISQLEGSENISVYTRLFESVCKVHSPISLVDDFVIITFTSAFNFLRRLMISAALYAAILPETPITTVFPFNMAHLYFSLFTIWNLLL